MIRFVIGILLMLGVAGAIENCPPDVSFGDATCIAGAFVVAFGLMASAAKSANV